MTISNFLHAQFTVLLYMVGDWNMIFLCFDNIDINTFIQLYQTLIFQKQI